MERPAGTDSTDSIAAFEAGLKKLVAVPKKALDEKVKTFKKRRHGKRASGGADMTRTAAAALFCLWGMVSPSSANAGAGWYLLTPPIATQAMAEGRRAELLAVAKGAEIGDPESITRGRQLLAAPLPKVGEVIEWAPLASWDQHGAYASAEQCEAERQRQLSALQTTVADQRLISRPAPWPPFLSAMLRSRCIATDDPRLK